MQQLEEALIDRARRSNSVGRPPWTRAASHPDLLPNVAPARREARAPTHLIRRCVEVAPQPPPSPPEPRRRTAQQQDAPDLVRESW
jgi:hypothetical protein